MDDAIVSGASGLTRPNAERNLSNSEPSSGVTGGKPVYDDRVSGTSSTNSTPIECCGEPNFPMMTACNDGGNKGGAAAGTISGGKGKGKGSKNFVGGEILNEKKQPHNWSNELYAIDKEALANIRRTKPWVNQPTYFQTVKITPSAAMKMLMHAYSGVEKGIKGGGRPVEVMGMLVGRPDTVNVYSLIVTDVFPLPVEGAETRVLADDTEVSNHMIELGEMLEISRNEHFMGWYHSHPFDVESHSHCYLSSMDLSTQLAWQQAEDLHGNPWLAIVIDPLRSLAKNYLEFGAFRAYLGKNQPPPNTTPDGKVTMNDSKIVERWGSCWSRYYSLEIEYFVNSLASNVIETLTKSSRWMRSITTAPTLGSENLERFTERIAAIGAETIASVSSRGGAAALQSTGTKRKKMNFTKLEKATRDSNTLALEHLQVRKPVGKTFKGEAIHKNVDNSSMYKPQEWGNMIDVDNNCVSLTDERVKALQSHLKVHEIYQELVVLSSFAMMGPTSQERETFTGKYVTRSNQKYAFTQILLQEVPQ